MANYGNIKPYADFAHAAAQNGGVQNYLNRIADSNYKLGVMDEQSTEGWKVMLVTGFALALWEGGKWLFQKGKQYYQEQRAEVIKEAELAEEAVIREVQKTEEPESIDEFIRRRMKELEIEEGME